jgi:hypothetical protein
LEIYGAFYVFHSFEGMMGLCSGRGERQAFVDGYSTSLELLTVVDWCRGLGVSSISFLCDHGCIHGWDRVLSPNASRCFLKAYMPHTHS